MRISRLAMSAAFGLVLACSGFDAEARGGGGGGRGGGGGHGGGGHGGHGGGHHGGGHHGHGGHHHHGGYYYGGWYGAAYYGWGWGWGWPWYAGYPYYAYAYPVYEPAPVGYGEIIPPAPATLWYYCNEPAGYYPYVERCNVPWIGVSPQPQATR